MAAIIALAAGVLTLCLILLCFGDKAAKEDHVRDRINNLTVGAGHGLTVQNEEMSQPFAERVLRPLIRKLASRRSPKDKDKNNSNTEKQRKLLQQAGWTISAEEYSVLRTILMVGCGLLCLVLAFVAKQDALHCVMYFIFGIFLVYAVMRYACAAAVTKRKAAIEKQLPDLLDLLSITVAAGLGFEKALARLIETMDGPLIDEFAVAYREMAMGRSRREALTLLGERCGVEDLSTVTAALVQAGQLGIPMGNVLQSQAAAIRRSRRSKVQEKAAKVSTKILLPMVGLIFPVLFIVLMGPAVISIVDGGLG